MYIHTIWSKLLETTTYTPANKHSYGVSTIKVNHVLIVAISFIISIWYYYYHLYPWPFLTRNALITYCELYSIISTYISITNNVIIIHFLFDNCPIIKVLKYPITFHQINHIPSILYWYVTSSSVPWQYEQIEERLGSFFYLLLIEHGNAKPPIVMHHFSTKIVHAQLFWLSQK